MKNNLLVLILLFLSMTLISCSSSINTNADKESNAEIQQTEDVKEPELPTIFEALGKTYTSSKDLSQIEEGFNIYDDQQSIHYSSGEYKEIDFINDLLYLYLNEDSTVYDYLVSYDSSSENGYVSITESNKEKLIKDLNSLRSQMELATGEEMIVRLDKVTFEGVSLETNTGSTFKIRVAISRVGATVVPWNYFTVTVFEDGNKLLAHLF
ncbi:hypothetical protein R0131_09490 [Clostridium sp. AL.422]|uniref:hypothetical protein n=1 Tax=Clostridium TaxID=1485 RepID=UPI00293DA44D|nr:MULTISPECIES: hypothetical protein [unclassified Clostridium]MDV4151070.1 hypothetical protein [Clostridium sp. AL.422]